MSTADSDGRADFAIYRAKSTEFITLDSTLADSVLSDPGPSNLGGQVLGLWGDIPVPANYGGVDKKSDFAVFRLDGSGFYMGMPGVGLAPTFSLDELRDNGLSAHDQHTQVRVALLSGSF